MIPVLCCLRKHQLSLRTVFCFLSGKWNIKRERAGGRKEKETCRPDWIRERACFSSPCQCTPAAGWIDSDGLPVGFHYVLCTSDLHKKKTASLPSSCPLSTEHTLPSEGKVQNCSWEWKKKRKKKEIARGDFFQCIFLISSSDLKSPLRAFFLLSKTLSSTLWGLHWNAASI